jgi:hypothetical protein
VFIVTRTQEEITSRFAESDDFFGWAREVLIERLDHDHAKPYIKDGVTAEEWAGLTADHVDLDAEIRRYLAFAVRKIKDERGLSAERSVIKLREMAWLAGRDDVVEAMDAAEYPQYGEPKVRAFAAGLGLGWPTT